MPQGTDYASWIGPRYDWIDSATGDLDIWKSHNPDVTATLYYHWLILNTVGDPSSAPADVSDYRFSMLWYDYCVQNGIDWETGFYHLSTSDTDIVNINLSSYGDRWDAKIRYVHRNAATENHADDCWGGDASLGLAAQDEAVYFGRLDRFSEITLNFATPASSDWQGAWEYWNGSAWDSLPITSDTTNDCTADGNVTFAPPPTAAAWARTRVNDRPRHWGPAGVYFVRLRCSTPGATAPVIKLAHGRHYWEHLSSSANRVPAWDPANDPDGDGYAQASANPNATARFEYEARLPHFWAWCQYTANLNDATLRDKFIDFTEAQLDAAASATNRYDGARLDDMSGSTNLPGNARGKILEYPGLDEDATVSQWQADAVAMVTAGRAQLHSAGYLLGGNVGHTGLPELNAVFDFHLREDAAAADRVNTLGSWGNWEEHIFPADAEWQLRGDDGAPMQWQWQLRMYLKAEGSYPAVTLTNGSATITGSGSDWLSTVEPGDILHVNVSGTDYFLTVAGVQSATGLTLTTAWAGPTATVPATSCCSGTSTPA